MITYSMNTIEIMVLIIRIIQRQFFRYNKQSLDDTL